MKTSSVSIDDLRGVFPVRHSPVERTHHVRSTPYGKVTVYAENGATVSVQTDGGAMFIPGISTIEEPPLNDLWTVPGEADLRFTSNRRSLPRDRGSGHSEKKHDSVQQGTYQ